MFSRARLVPERTMMVSDYRIAAFPVARGTAHTTKPAPNWCGLFCWAQRYPVGRVGGMVALREWDRRGGGAGGVCGAPVGILRKAAQRLFPVGPLFFPRSCGDSTAAA